MIVVTSAVTMAIGKKSTGQFGELVECVEQVTKLIALGR